MGERGVTGIPKEPPDPHGEWVMRASGQITVDHETFGE